MTRDDVALLACKAGYDDVVTFGDKWLDRLVAFAKLVRAYQRTHVTYSCPACGGSMEQNELRQNTHPL